MKRSKTSVKGVTRYCHRCCLYLTKKTVVPGRVKCLAEYILKRTWNRFSDMMN